MKTISKNALLSVKALVFGAAIVTGVNAFGMDKEQAQRDYQETLKNVKMVTDCAEETLKSDKLSTFPACMASKNGHSEDLEMSKSEIMNGVSLSALSFPIACIGSKDVNSLAKIASLSDIASNDPSCWTEFREIVETAKSLNDRIKNDEQFSNN